MKKILIAIAVTAALAAFLFASSRPKEQNKPAVTNEPGVVSLNQVSKENAAVQKPEVKKKYKVTFVELGSVRCVPCKMMMPLL